jgi:hypothetical protein
MSVVESNLRLEGTIVLGNFTLTVGEVVDHVKDNWGRWRYVVRLKGGRIVGLPLADKDRAGDAQQSLGGENQLDLPPGVLPLFQGASATYADRAALAPVGSWGIVAYPEAETNNSFAFWLGSFEALVPGVQSDPDTSLTQRPDGTSTASTPTGTTRRDANGDTAYEGSEAPYDFRVRDESGTVTDPPSARKGINRVFDYALTRLYSLRIAKSLLFQMDPVKRRIAILVDDKAVDGIIIEDGRIQAKTEAMQVGPRPGAATPVALWPATFTTLRNLARKISYGDVRYNDLAAKFAELNAYVSDIRQNLELHSHPANNLPSLNIVITSSPPQNPSQIPDSERGEALYGLKSVKVLDGASQSLLAE